MHSAFLAVSTTRWESPGHAVNWLGINSEELEANMEEKDAKVAPDVVWWAIAVAVKAFARAVDKCF